MSLLTRIRGRARAGAGLARTRIGEAVVVHVADGGTAEARALAASLPADPDHELVVADLPPESPIEVWESFAAALPKGRRPVRLVPGRHPREIAPHVWQRLAEQTGRAVLAPYGLTQQGAAGSLFVHSRAHSGWGWFRRGQAPAWEAKRFPRPAWDSPAVAEIREAGAGSVAEPLPAGMWLRSNGADSWLAAGRARLTRTLPCQPDAPTIVLGGQGIADLELVDVAAFWWTLPTQVRAKARFVRFGGVVLPEGTTLGQALADVLDADVRCYTGIPVGSPDAPEVFTLRSDGSHGWNTFAQEFVYRPRSADAEPTAPRLGAHRSPIADLREVSPGVYEYAPDTVIEVVEAGLWVRPAEQITDVAAVRAAPLDPVHNLVRYEADDPTTADRLREIAEGLVDRLDYATRLATRLLPSTALSGAQPAEPAEHPEPDANTATEEPAETALPLLSRLMETLAIQVSDLPSQSKHSPATPTGLAPVSGHMGVS